MNKQAIEPAHELVGRLAAISDPAGLAIGSRRAAAIWFAGRATSYGRFARRICAAARGLESAGVGRGDRVGLALPPGPAAYIGLAASWRIGAVVMPIEPGEDAAAAVAFAQKAGVRHVILADAAVCIPLAEAFAAAGIGLLVLAVSLDRPRRERILRSPVRLPAGAKPLIAPGGVWARWRAVAPALASVPQDAALLLATTIGGVERAILLTHANLDAAVAACRATLPDDLSGNDRVLLAWPASSPLAAVLAFAAGWRHGGEVSLPDGCSAAAMVDVINRRRPTVVIASAAVLDAVMAPAGRRRLFSGSNEIAPGALSDCRFVLVIDGPMPPRAAKALRARCSAVIVDAYQVPPGILVASSRVRPASEGAGLTLLPGTGATIRDGAQPMREMPRGERGEIFVSGPQVPHTDQIDPGQSSGFGSELRSGDLGVATADGGVMPIGRLGDLIVTAGYLIYPRRIEAALLEHERVGAVAVVGRPSARGVVPVAYVVLRPPAAGADASPVGRDTLMDHLKGRLSRIEMPADIEVRAALPLRPSGAVDRAALRREG
jgi:long-chain acyl-CoA synthetase